MNITYIFVILMVLMLLMLWIVVMLSLLFRNNDYINIIDIIEW